MGNFVIFILALFVLAALLRIDFFFTVLYLFAGVYILSQLWSQRMLKRLQISRNLQQRAYLGDRVTVTIKLENLSWLPIPWLVFSESFSVDLASPPFFREVITLAGKASHTAQYTLTARKRGYYRIGPLRLQTGDLLGLKRELIDHFDATHLIVYPKIIPISHLVLPTHSPQVVLPWPLPIFEDAARLLGVRDYTQGDNLRHIHWSATAATGKVLVKQFQPAIARDNAIFLNLSRPDYAQHGYPEPVIELAIMVAASLANHMIVFEELPVGLMTTAMDPLAERQRQFKLLPRKGRDQLMQILEVLARVQVNGEDTRFLAGVRQEAVHLSWGTTAIIITSHETEELSQLLLFLKRSGLRVTLVLVQPMEGRIPKQAGQARELSIPIFKIRREQEVEVWSPAA